MCDCRVLHLKKKQLQLGMTKSTSTPRWKNIIAIKNRVIVTLCR